MMDVPNQEVGHTRVDTAARVGSRHGSASSVLRDATQMLPTTSHQPIDTTAVHWYYASRTLNVACY